jgi:uncharacterized membrane protein
MTDVPADQAAISDRSGMVTIVYVLYLVGLVVGITPLIGVIMAYVNRSGAPEWAQSHYRLQIRTFWIGLLYGVIGIALSLVIIGWLLLLFTVVWMIVRCVKGLKFASAMQSYPNATTWLW